MSDTNKGRDFVLNITEDDGATFKTIGMVQAKDLSISNPMQNVTAQDTAGPYSDHNHTGYAQFGMTISGVVRERAGVDPVSSLTYFTYKELAAIVNRSDVTGRVMELQLISPVESWEGIFLITEFSQSGGQEEIREFSMTLQNEGEITHAVVA